MARPLMLNYKISTIMKQFYSIKIPSPCNENWNRMTPNEKGRFCNSCSKTVIDFTYMDTFEIQDFINTNKGKSICGHIKQSQLDSINLEIPIQSINKDIQFHRLFLYALLITMGTTLLSCTMDNGNIKKIDSVEIVDTSSKTIDSTPKPTCSINNNNTKLEKVINSNETIEGLMVVGDITYSENHNPKELFNFYNVDMLPEFPNTPKNLNKIEKRKFFQNEIVHFVKTNFNHNTSTNLGLKGKQKILVRFEIDKDGKTNLLKVRAPHLLLEKETKRVLQQLPVFKPARKKQKVVSVLYNLPITVNFD